MPECIVDTTQYNLRCWCKYRVFTQNEEFAAYTGTDFYQKILQFVCAVCMAQHSCSLHLYVQFVWDACRLQYGCAIQTAHTNPELHKTCSLHLYVILYVIHACDPIQTAHTKSWFLLSLLESLSRLRTSHQKYTEFQYWASWVHQYSQNSQKSEWLSVRIPVTAD